MKKLLLMMVLFWGVPILGADKESVPHNYCGFRVGELLLLQGSGPLAYLSYLKSVLEDRHVIDNQYACRALAGHVISAVQQYGMLSDYKKLIQECCWLFLAQCWAHIDVLGEKEVCRFQPIRTYLNDMTITMSDVGVQLENVLTLDPVSYDQVRFLLNMYDRILQRSSVVSHGLLLQIQRIKEQIALLADVPAKQGFVKLIDKLVVQAKDKQAPTTLELIDLYAPENRSQYLIPELETALQELLKCKREGESEIDKNRLQVILTACLERDNLFVDMLIERFYTAYGLFVFAPEADDITTKDVQLLVACLSAMTQDGSLKSACPKKIAQLSESLEQSNAHRLYLHGLLAEWFEHDYCKAHDLYLQAEKAGSVYATLRMPYIQCVLKGLAQKQVHSLVEGLVDDACVHADKNAQNRVRIEDALTRVNPCMRALDKELIDDCVWYSAQIGVPQEYANSARLCAQLPIDNVASAIEKLWEFGKQGDLCAQKYLLEHFLYPGDSQDLVNEFFCSPCLSFDDLALLVEWLAQGSAEKVVQAVIAWAGEKNLNDFLRCQLALNKLPQLMEGVRKKALICDAQHDILTIENLLANDAMRVQLAQYIKQIHGLVCCVLLDQSSSSFDPERACNLLEKEDIDSSLREQVRDQLALAVASEGIVDILRNACEYRLFHLYNASNRKETKARAYRVLYGLVKKGYLPACIEFLTNIELPVVTDFMRAERIDKMVAIQKCLRGGAAGGHHHMMLAYINQCIADDNTRVDKKHMIEVDELLAKLHTCDLRSSDGTFAQRVDELFVKAYFCYERYGSAVTSADENKLKVIEQFGSAEEIIRRLDSVGWSDAPLFCGLLCENGSSEQEHFYQKGAQAGHQVCRMYLWQLLRHKMYSPVPQELSPEERQDIHRRLFDLGSEILEKNDSQNRPFSISCFIAERLIEQGGDIERARQLLRDGMCAGDVESTFCYLVHNASGHWSDPEKNTEDYLRYFKVILTPSVLSYLDAPAIKAKFVHILKRISALCIADHYAAVESSNAVPEATNPLVSTIAQRNVRKGVRKHELSQKVGRQLAAIKELARNTNHATSDCLSRWYELFVSVDDQLSANELSLSGLIKRLDLQEDQDCLMMYEFFTNPPTFLEGAVKRTMDPELMRPQIKMQNAIVEGDLRSLSQYAEQIGFVSRQEDGSFVCTDPYYARGCVSLLMKHEALSDERHHMVLRYLLDRAQAQLALVELLGWSGKLEHERGAENQRNIAFLRSKIPGFASVQQVMQRKELH